MTPVILAVSVNIISAILALLAGGAWIKSAQAFVPAPSGVGTGAVLGGKIYDKDVNGRKFDVLETIKLQSLWNRRAAWLAAASALCQFLSVALSVISDTARSN